MNEISSVVRRKSFSFSAFNFHDAHNEHLSRVELSAGDDAGEVFWLDVDSQLPLFASHAAFLARVADLRDGHG